MKTNNVTRQLLKCNKKKDPKNNWKCGTDNSIGNGCLLGNDPCKEFCYFFNELTQLTELENCTSCGKYLIIVMCVWKLV